MVQADRPFVPSTRPHPSDVGGKREIDQYAHASGVGGAE